jgi:hypothetical protein
MSSKAISKFCRFAGINTVVFPHKDFSSNAYYSINTKLLKMLFKKALKQDPNLWVFQKHFKIPKGKVFHDLTQGNSNFPNIYCTSDKFGNVFVNYQFKDAKSNLVYITVSFSKNGDDCYSVSTVSFISRVNHSNEQFTIDIDKSLFVTGTNNTKDQVLNMVFSYLGELSLIMFFDYFVDTHRENDYNKSKILSRYMEQYFCECDITYDTSIKTFFVKPKNNNDKNDFRRSSAYVRMLGMIMP